MDLKYNPLCKADIDAERERREEMMSELMSGMAAEGGDEDEEEFDASPSAELEALLPYYNQVEDEALKVAKRYFRGTFISDSRDVHNQKLFEYEHNGHIYRCYVDIYNENNKEINVIEVKATTCRKFAEMTYGKKGSTKSPGVKFPVFVKDCVNNVFRLNAPGGDAEDAVRESFKKKKGCLLNRFRDEGKYPHDVAFQRFVIEHALDKAGDHRRLNFYLAVLNSDYVFDGGLDKNGACDYRRLNGQEIITFIDMNEVSEDYQPLILREIATLESYISTPHDIGSKVDVGEWCAWKKNTECVFYSHCFKKLRTVPDYNRSNSYLNFQAFKKGGISGKYQLINEGYYKMDDVPVGWLESENHKIQRDCYDNGTVHVDREKIDYWFSRIEYPIYHLDFEAFPCPLPRFRGETPYRQSVFEFSLHIERQPGVCDKVKDNLIFLNQECYDDEREAMAKAIVDNFEFDENGNLMGTMLAQNTSYEIGRLKELAAIFPKYKDKLLNITKKTADVIHLLKTNAEIYKDIRPKVINYYHKDLSGSYSIKKTLPVLVPSLTYKGMDVGNGVQAYIAYLNYDSAQPTFGIMKTKAERRAALSRYCQQDTWAMVEILRAARKL